MKLHYGKADRNEKLDEVGREILKNCHQSIPLLSLTL